MITLLQTDLEFAKRKLHYYNELKTKNPSKKATPPDRWIEIYSERVQKLEKQIHKLQAQAHAQAHGDESAKPGLKTQVASAAASAKGRAKSRA